jgi:hypothetical protein
MKILDQAYNTLVETWNNLNISVSGRFSILKEYPAPDTIREVAAAFKGDETRPITDSDRIYSIQQDSGVMRAFSHALVNVSRYHYDYRDGKSAVSEGKISTCGVDPVGSDLCEGSEISVDCPEIAYTPMVLNPCVWKLHNEQFPELIEREPNVECLELAYLFDSDKIHLNACVGRELSAEGLCEAKPV